MDDETKAEFDRLHDELRDVRDEFRNYTHLFQFTPVRNVVYWLLGGFGTLALTVIAALIVSALNGGS